MTLFDMFNKAAGLTEDAKKYNTGDISEKTGLQKQPDGSWKPPKAKGSQPKGTEKKSKATYGPASRLFETKLPPKVSFHSKDRQTEILNNIAKRKSQSGKVSESDLSIPHEEVKKHQGNSSPEKKASEMNYKEAEKHLNQFEDAPQKSKPLTRTEATERVFQNHIKEFKDIKKQYSKLPRKELERVYSQKVSRTNSVETLPKGEIAEALTQHEMLNKYSGEIRDLLKKPENTNDSAPLTADTKIKLSQIKTTDDAKRYNIGDISEKTGLQKTANGWVRPKKQKTSG